MSYKPLNTATTVKLIPLLCSIKPTKFIFNNIYTNTTTTFVIGWIEIVLKFNITELNFLEDRFQNWKILLSVAIT